MIKYIKPFVNIHLPWNVEHEISMKADYKIKKPSDNFLFQITKTGKICYKSGRPITKESAKKFVEVAIKAEHGSCLEFGNISLKLHPMFPGQAYDGLKIRYPFASITNTDYLRVDTTLRDLYASWLHKDNPWSDTLLHQIGFEKPEDTADKLRLLNHVIKIIDEGKITENNIKLERPLKEYFEHNENTPLNMEKNGPRILIKFVSNRAFSHQLVRHRGLSFLQESMRYCKYLKSLNIIDPCIYGLNKEEKNKLTKFYKTVSEQYDLLIEQGHKAEVARMVLPQQSKTEIYCMGFSSYWQSWIFWFRDNKKADPVFRLAMAQMINEINKY